MDTNSNTNIPSLLELARIEGELLTIKARVRLNIESRDEDGFKEYHHDIIGLAEDFGYGLGIGNFESPTCKELVSSINALAKELEATDVGNLWNISETSGFVKGNEMKEITPVKTIYLVNMSIIDQENGGTPLYDFDEACDFYREGMKFTAFDLAHQGRDSGENVSIYSKEILLSDFENVKKKLSDLSKDKILDDSFKNITSSICLVDGGLSPDDETLKFSYWIDYAKKEREANRAEFFKEDSHGSPDDNEVDIFVVRYELLDGKNHGAYFKNLDTAKEFFNNSMVQEHNREPDCDPACDEPAQFLASNVSLFTKKTHETDLESINFRYIHQPFDDESYEDITASTEGLYASRDETQHHWDRFHKPDEFELEQIREQEPSTFLENRDVGEPDKKEFEKWIRSPESLPYQYKFIELQRGLNENINRPERCHLRGEHQDQFIIDSKNAIELLKSELKEVYKEFKYQDNNDTSKNDNNVGFAELKNLSLNLQTTNPLTVNPHTAHLFIDKVLWRPGKPWAEDNLVYNPSTGDHVSESSGRAFCEIAAENPELLLLDKDKFVAWHKEKGGEYQKPGMVLTPELSEKITSEVRSYCLPNAPEPESLNTPSIDNEVRSTRMR